MANPEEIKAKIAMRVQSLLDAKQLGQADLARAAGISKAHLNRIVQGKQNLSIKTLASLENALESPIIAVYPLGDGERD